MAFYGGGGSDARLGPAADYPPLTLTPAACLKIALACVLVIPPRSFKLRGTRHIAEEVSP
jgi:hypothetical protein